MPQQPDYDALARQHGGTVATGGIDYDALASQQGGAPSSRSWLDSVGDYLSEALQGVNPKSVIQGVDQAVLHPVDTVKAMGQAQGALKQKAEDAFKRGDYASGIRHAIDYFLPIVGPRLDQAADYMQQGQYAKGLGATTDVALQTMGPEVAGRVVAATPRPNLTMAPADPAVAEAVSFGQAHGVPIDAATATDNPAVRMVQNLSDRSLGGSQVASKARATQQAKLATLGEQLAAKGYPNPVTAEQAGQAIRTGVNQTIGQNAAVADANYAKLRAIEAKTPIPVDFTPVKDAIEPLYATVAQGADVAPLQGSKGAAARAMARILNAPDIVDASVADSALSDLKALQRDAAGTPGAGLANAAVDAVSQAVTQAVTKAGPQALHALQEGRSATTAKYLAQDVLDGLNDEPVKTINSLTTRGDSAIDKLREVAQQAPQTLPQVGRAVLDGLMNDPTKGADAQFSAWNKLGTQTKQMLFRWGGPNYVKDLDNFFQLQKTIAENPNPSGSGYGVGALAQASTVAHPLSFAASVAGSAGLSAFLHSDAGVRLLTSGLRLPPAATGARVAWMARVKDFVRAATVTGSAAQPAVAGAGR